MLIDGRNFWKLHRRWVLGTAIAAGGAAVWTLVASWCGGRWVGGGSLSGLTLGTLAAAIFLFEMALVAKKTRTFRTARWLPPAQVWMKAHIWLGLLTVPLVVLHSGGRLGGTLTTVFATVFAVVIFSGVWGLVLQNILPRMLLHFAPSETVYSQIENVAAQYAAEARWLVTLACGGVLESAEAETIQTGRRSPPQRLAEHIHGAARQLGLQTKRSPHPARDLPKPIPSPAIEKALTQQIGPYLERGSAARGQLGSRPQNQWFFNDLRLRVQPELRGLVDQLEELCERRRQLALQQRLHFWLHNWLWIHLPLSIALVVLLVAHVVFALQFG